MLSSRNKKKRAIEAVFLHAQDGIMKGDPNFDELDNLLSNGKLKKKSAEQFREIYARTIDAYVTSRTNTTRHLFTQIPSIELIDLVVDGEQIENSAINLLNENQKSFVKHVEHDILKHESHAARIVAIERWHVVLDKFLSRNDFANARSVSLALDYAVTDQIRDNVLSAKSNEIMARARQVFNDHGMFKTLRQLTVGSALPDYSSYSNTAIKKAGAYQNEDEQQAVIVKEIDFLKKMQAQNAVLLMDSVPHVYNGQELGDKIETIANSLNVFDEVEHDSNRLTRHVAELPERSIKAFSSRDKKAIKKAQKLLIDKTGIDTSDSNESVLQMRYQATLDKLYACLPSESQSLEDARPYQLAKSDKDFTNQKVNMLNSYLTLAEPTEKNTREIMDWIIGMVDTTYSQRTLKRLEAEYTETDTKPDFFSDIYDIDFDSSSKTFEEVFKEYFNDHPSEFVKMAKKMLGMYQYDLEMATIKFNAAEKAMDEKANSEENRQKEWLKNLLNEITSISSLTYRIEYLNAKIEAAPYARVEKELGTLKGDDEATDVISLLVNLRDVMIEKRNVEFAGFDEAETSQQVEFTLEHYQALKKAKKETKNQARKEVNGKANKNMSEDSSDHEKEGEKEQGKELEGEVDEKGLSAPKKGMSDHELATSFSADVIRDRSLTYNELWHTTSFTTRGSLIRKDKPPVEQDEAVKDDEVKTQTVKVKQRNLKATIIDTPSRKRLSGMWDSCKKVRLTRKVDKNKKRENNDADLPRSSTWDSGKFFSKLKSNSAGHVLTHARSGSSMRKGK